MLIAVATPNESDYGPVYGTASCSDPDVKEDSHPAQIFTTTRASPTHLFEFSIGGRLAVRCSRKHLMGIGCFAIAGATFILMPQFSVADEDNCLNAESNGVTNDAASADEHPASGAVVHRVDKLRLILGVQGPLVVVDVPGGGIGAARAPCAKSGRSIPTVAIDVDALQDVDHTRPMSADVVIAHELSHVLQFAASPPFVTAICSPAKQNVKTYELLADFGAGYAMFKIAGPTTHQIFAQTMAALSDYKFTSVKHHGTVTERLNAFDMGLAAAYFGKPLNMGALIRNQQSFLQFLGGPLMPLIASGSTTQLKYTQDALEAIYK